MYRERFRDIDESALEEEYPFKNIRYTQGEMYQPQEPEQEQYQPQEPEQEQYQPQEPEQEQYQPQEPEQEQYQPQEPEQESIYEQSMSYELQELDKESEFELFTNIIHDTEFEQLTI